MPEKKQPTLILTVRPENILALTTLLQRGFLVPCRGPVTLTELLIDLLGFDQKYISKSIETIFINGCACDSLEQYIFPSTSVALSAAMPGLAGAIFRKGGAHASLRSQPVHKSLPREATAGFITVKLFNMVATDKGEELLTKGILVKGSILSRFFSRQQERLRSLDLVIRHNAGTLSLKDAVHWAAPHHHIQFSVDTCEYIPSNH